MSGTHTQIHAHSRTHKHARTQTPRSTQVHTRSVTHARTVRALARVRTHLHTHDKQQHTRRARQPLGTHRHDTHTCTRKTLGYWGPLTTTAPSRSAGRPDCGRTGTHTSSHHLHIHAWLGAGGGIMMVKLQRDRRRSSLRGRVGKGKQMHPDGHSVRHTGQGGRGRSWTKFKNTGVAATHTPPPPSPSSRAPTPLAPPLPPLLQDE